MFNVSKGTVSTVINRYREEAKDLLAKARLKRQIMEEARKKLVEEEKEKLKDEQNKPTN
jgi:transposase